MEPLALVEDRQGCPLGSWAWSERRRRTYNESGSIITIMIDVARNVATSDMRTGRDEFTPPGSVWHLGGQLNPC